MQQKIDDPESIEAKNVHLEDKPGEVCWINWKEFSKRMLIYPRQKQEFKMCAIRRKSASIFVVKDGRTFL